MSESLEINEYKSDIYYGNGIMTTKDEAWTSLRETLKPAILYEIYNGNKERMNSDHNLSVSYNWSAKEKFENTAIAMALDLLESYEQLGNTSWGWWTAQQIMSFAIGKANYLKDASGAMVSKALKGYGLPEGVADFLAGQVLDTGIGVLDDMAKAMLDYNADEMHDKNLCSFPSSPMGMHTSTQLNKQNKYHRT